MFKFITNLFGANTKQITTQPVQQPIINSDELPIHYEYEKSSIVSDVGGYSTTTKFEKIKLKRILEKYKDQSFNNLYSTTTHNDILYVLFDIDDYNKYQHFCENFKSDNYVSILSSPGHYWVIVDKPFKKFKDFISDELYTDWIVYTDEKYVNMTISRQFFNIRLLFRTLNRQPTISNRVGNLSENFKTFIEKLENFHQNESLELSTLRYKDPEMLNKLKRIKKLERILN